MFLDETLNTSLDFDTLMSESYENLIEYQNEMHELDMKMIKCEHTCIVNEDSDMMMLAEEEYKNSVISAVKAVWNKIVLAIQKFIQSLRSVILKARQKFASKEVKAQIEKTINDPNTRNELKKVFYNKAQKVKYFGVIEHMSEFESKLTTAVNSLKNNFTKEAAMNAKEQLTESEYSNLLLYSSLDARSIDKVVERVLEIYNN